MPVVFSSFTAIQHAVLIFVKLKHIIKRHHLPPCIRMYLAVASVCITLLVACCVFKSRRPRKPANMFLVLPDVYRPHGAVEKMRLVIEYNMRVGPVAAHFDDGDKWGFLSAYVIYKNIEGGFLTRWSLFLDDYMKFGVNNVTAVATHVCEDTMRLTMSSENVVLHEMIVGKEFIAARQ